MLGALFVGVALGGCGDPSGEMQGEGGEGVGGAAPQVGGGGQAPSEGGAASGGGGEGGSGPLDTIAMDLMSAGAPAYAGSGSASQPEAASDMDHGTAWNGHAPDWLAFDLSAKPEGERQAVLVAWNAPHAPDFIPASPFDGMAVPVDFVIETNAAAGGGAPPADGWVSVAEISGNDRGAGEHLVQMSGASWIRMRVSSSTDASGAVAIDLGVYAAPHGATDGWLFMGDSITFMTMMYAFSDLPELVHASRDDRFPHVIDAAIGGTSTTTALDSIADTLEGYPGRYVVLAYGTNDHPNSFAMETLVQTVLDHGKIPVVPHMPWSTERLTEGVEINAMIDALYVAYPEIVKGPDLWSVFEDRTDLIPQGDVHPNAEGQEVLRGAWADSMAGIP